LSFPFWIEKMSLPPSFLIVGTGALACLFAARFSAAGVPVTMLGTWPDGIAALRKTGVTLVDADGTEHNHPVRVITQLGDCQNLELGLVLVKSWQTDRVAHQLRGYLSPQGQVLSLQNGLGNRQKLAESLGIERVFQGVTTVGGTLLGPGRVRSGGEGLITLESILELLPWIDLFELAGFEVEKNAEIETLIWGKLAINAAINPLTAILNVPNGALLNQPQSRMLMFLAAAEVAAVAATQGLRLPFDDVGVAVEAVARRTARNHSSMLQDVRRGAPTEIEAINGAVIQAGEQVGVPTPVNQTLFLLVKSMVVLKSTQ
jgi:2-dehydropantoate 2-reductase